MDTLKTLNAKPETPETLIYWMKRLTLALEANTAAHSPPKQVEPIDPEEENYGINPEEHYTDKELQYMVYRCRKTTERWREQGLIEYFKGEGEKGAISYFGIFIITFLRKYRKQRQLGKIRSVKKESQPREV